MNIIWADPPTWEVNPGAYEFTATIAGGIVLSGGEQFAEAGDLFAAFDDVGNVRGVAVQLIPPFGSYEGEIVYEMQLRSNTVGDLLTFKYYDASEDAVINILEDYTFVINDILGDVNNPVFYNISSEIILYLHSGHNLISFYVLPEDTSITNVLSSIGDNAVSFQGEGAGSMNTENGWLGSLTTISYKEGYWLYVNGTDTLNITGEPVHPDMSYALQIGPNLISYPFAGSAAIAQTIPVEAQSSITGIIGEGLSANNSVDFGWIGSLTNLQGTKGYWFITSDDIEFIYNPPVSSNNLIRIKYHVTRKLPEIYTYVQSAQQAFYFIKSVENIDIGDWILAYNGETVIGAREWTGEIIDVPAMGDDGTDFTNNYIQTGSIPTFKVLSDGELTNIESDIPAWSNNQIYMLASLTESISLPETFSLERAYPNPFNPATTLHFSLPIEAEVSLTVYNLHGRQLISLIDGNMEAGYHSVVWNAEKHSSGIYFVKMIADDFIHTQKLMLVK